MTTIGYIAAAARSDATVHDLVGAARPTFTTAAAAWQHLSEHRKAALTQAWDGEDKWTDAAAEGMALRAFEGVVEAVMPGELEFDDARHMIYWVTLIAMDD